MEPYLKKWPQKKRNAAFVPFLLGGFLLGFVLGGFLTHEFVFALLAGPIVGIAAAYFLVGLPHLTTRSGRVIVNERVRPWLFFPLFGVAALFTYVVLGVFLTPLLAPQILPYVVLGVSVVAAAALAFLLAGFPNLGRVVREQWARVPEERRPFLFFPIAVLFGLAFYFAYGILLTQTEIPLEIQPLLVLPLAFATACVAAYFLVGFPRPPKPVREYVPQVPGRQRPWIFLATWLLLGLPATYVAGLVLTAQPGLPHAAILPIAFALGYVAALGLAAAAWGTPRRWRRFADYKPGLPDGARAALFLPIVALAAAVGAVAAATAGLDLFWGLLGGIALGVLVALYATGAMRRLRELRGDQGTLLPELPDMVKPLVLFPVWILVGGTLLVVLTYAVPDALAWNVATSLALGLLAAVLLVEEPTLREWAARRRVDRARVVSLKRRRAEALKGARAGAAAQPDDQA